MVHLEVLVEEQSAEKALKALLPKLGVTDFHIHSFQGKQDLLRKLPERLAGYSKSLPTDSRVVVILDRDRDDCAELKGRLQTVAVQAGMTPKSQEAPDHFRVLNRVVVNELEAWFLGDVEAVRAAYPRVPSTLASKARYRDPDAIRGGASEALERVLQRAGYYTAGLPKIEAAERISAHMDPDRNRSHSFQVFCSGVRALLASG